MINLVPLTSDTTMMVPIDVDRDPTGDLVIVGSRAGYTARPVRDGEEPEGRFRRRAHWGVCQHVARWRDVMRAAGVVGPTTTHDPSRAGPCVRCRVWHPWRYGGPIASPVCDRCRAETGAPLMGEYD
jgi:hypothetical protein